ncbi:MAG: hypothetical protein M3Y08_00815 [Fibrobacterota bacterium]|nr:hypothetical protein [Fibrobacterota bacterium]
MKKIITFLFLALATFSFAASKSESVTRIKSGGAAIYKSEASDESDKVADIGTGDEVSILKQGKARSLVKTAGAIKGWVDNGTLEKVKISSGGAHNLKDVEVVGWLDNPSAVYILDNTNPDLNALPIDRNFNNEIVEKKDREEVERTYDEN